MTPLRRRVIEAMQVRKFAPNTQRVYLQQVTAYANYFHQSRKVLGPADVQAYQVYWVIEKKRAPATLHTIAALRFLYQVALGRNWKLDETPVPKKPLIPPVILSPEEVSHFPHRPGTELRGGRCAARNGGRLSAGTDRSIVGNMPVRCAAGNCVP